MSTICKRVWNRKTISAVQSLCISREQNRARDKKRQDGCWLLTSVWKQQIHLDWDLNYLQNKTKQITSSLLRTLPFIVRSPSRLRPGGWDLTPDWPVQRASPAAECCRRWWWATRAAAAQEELQRAAVWSETRTFFHHQLYTLELIFHYDRKGAVMWMLQWISVKRTCLKKGWPMREVADGLTRNKTKN